jgi:geranylgeranyl diphosphate synthase type II
MVLSEIQSAFDTALHSNAFDSDPQSLSDPLNYMMQREGKRIRPLLVLCTYQAFKKQLSPKAIDLALCSEMFHNFSLMHDDIMDQSELRSGRPTVHKKWNVNTAILSGDLMLIRVYEKLHRLGIPEILAAFDVMAVALCEGQQLDMEFELKEEVSAKDYMRMIRGKTAVLLGFCMESSALLAGESEDQVRECKDLGINLGLAFQLKDDYLDTFGETEKTGKSIGRDILNKKKTLLWNEMWQALSDEQKVEVMDLYKSDNQLHIIEEIKGLMKSTGSDKRCKSLIQEMEGQIEVQLKSLKRETKPTALEELLSLLSSRIY